MTHPDEPPLGKPTPSPREYAPSVLFGIPRDEGRKALGLTGDLPFEGVDVWNAYELSWLDSRGKPVVAALELRIPATSPRIVESKSLKLYLDSLNGLRHDAADDVERRIARDLERVVGADLGLRLTLGRDAERTELGPPEGSCIDDADVEIETYEVAPELLADGVEPDTVVEEALVSHLLKSNCPVTGQPDTATLIVRYRGPRIDRGALLRYIVSYRNHCEFHEQCVERIFVDLERHCAPTALSVYARYTRRGGIDINPFRSSFGDSPENARAWRQ